MGKKLRRLHCVKLFADVHRCKVNLLSLKLLARVYIIYLRFFLWKELLINLHRVFGKCASVRRQKMKSPLCAIPRHKDNDVSAKFFDCGAGMRWRVFRIHAFHMRPYTLIRSYSVRGPHFLFGVAASKVSQLL